MRTAAIALRIMQQMSRDKRTLALLFIAPLIILTLMYAVFQTNEKDLTLVVTEQQEITPQLKKAPIAIEERAVFNEQALQESDFDGWLLQQGTNWQLTLVNDEPARAKALQNTLALALQQSSNEQPNLALNYIYGTADTTSFDIFSPMLIGFFVFFFVFLIAGIALLKERTSGTLERLMATPINSMEIVFGYMLGYGIFALLQTIIVVLYAVYVLDIVLVGSLWLVLMINLCVALVALMLGTFLSSFATSEFQMVQFIPLVIVPQIFFTGIFPMSGMASWLQNFAKLMPLSYAASALNGVMYKGYVFGDIWNDIVVLLAFALLFTGLTIISLRKYRA